MQLSDIIELGPAKKNKSSTFKSEDNIKKSIENIIINNNFDYIYFSFNYENPLENDNITQKYLVWEKWNIFDNFISFCDFLIFKIKNSTDKDQIKKIPLIISNLSTYKWSSRNHKNKIIKEKRAEVMHLFKKKVYK